VVSQACAQVRFVGQRVHRLHGRLWRRESSLDFSVVSQWRQELGERVATIEEQIRPTIVGNGQPSRLAVVESEVDDLQHERWRLGGIIAGVTGVWALLTCGFEIIRHRLGF
jgi:hypothetical protein